MKVAASGQDEGDIWKGSTAIGDRNGLVLSCALEQQPSLSSYQAIKPSSHQAIKLSSYQASMR
jgi:hypothetical protein